MKTVFSNYRDVMHLFAQRTQSYAKSSNVFFRDNIIYSYGHHYELAEFHEINGETVIYINDRGYSSTTSKHIWEITAATKQYKQYFASNVNLSLVYNFIIKNYNLLLKARKPEKYILEIVSKFEKFRNENPFLTENTLKNSKFIEIEIIYNTIKDINSLESAIEKRKEAERKTKELEKRRVLESLSKFNNYEIDSFRANEDYIRISRDGQFIETNQYVKVPIREANILYQMILDKRDIKGFRIGNYTVISINGHLKIGCHNINIDNMHEVGKRILTLN